MLSSRRHCGSLPGHCLGNQGSFQIPAATMWKPEASLQPYMLSISAMESFTRYPQLLFHRALLATHPVPRPHSVVHTMPFRVQREERIKTTCTTLASTGQGGQSQPLQEGPPGKLDTIHSFISGGHGPGQLAPVHSFISGGLSLPGYL